MAPKRRRPAVEVPALAERQPRSVRELVAYGRDVIRSERAALALLEEQLEAPFATAVQWVLRCKGHVVLCGVGKPSFVAQKVSATFASIGVPSFFLHPSEAVHGDLGRVSRRDLVLVLSNSGRTEEVVRILGPLRALGVKLVAITGDADSPLARHSDLVLPLGPVLEACPLGLAPTASSTAMLVLGDALAMTVSAARQLSRDEFARFHPGGKLGRQLMRVGEVMRRGEENPCIPAGSPLREAVRVMTETPGRPGATHVVDADGRLLGLLTDGDLRRYLLRQTRGRPDLSLPVDRLMAHAPRTVQPGQLVEEALRVLADFKVDQVPVVDDAGRPVGLLDVQDLLAVRRL
ncbi:MAG: KpsF/GutQ family sugar-phosphate isomerase [Deltaproteobacteria bacterium]|nr:KpsF/GutQ family sugar-phosphate isomerase [Deltaproteobacteria bacterium]